ncbi:MAG: vitamin B12 dependent-methionine synthase activation domain-containing protein [Deltaproteobacteria bacterium]
MISTEAVQITTTVEKSDRFLELKPAFPKSEVFRLLGGGNGETGSRATSRKVQKWSEHLLSITEPEIVYSVQAVAEVGKGYVRLARGPVFRSRKLARAFRECELAVCFVGTLGHGIEDEIGSLTLRGKLADAFVVDALGSAGIEHAVERFYGALEDHFRLQGKGLTLRFSPGYCDWPLDQQAQLLDLVDTRLVGVTLLESSLMTPRKSISGIFGITSRRMASFTKYNPCVVCQQKHCIARRFS